MKRISHEMASSTFQTVAALLLLAAAASARLVGPTARHGRSALERLRGGAGETQLANVDALPFREALPWLRHVRTHGILQFLAIHDERKDESTDELCWGDEIEYQLVWLDEEEKKCRVCLRAPEVLAETAPPGQDEFLETLESARSGSGRPESFLQR